MRNSGPPSLQNFFEARVARLLTPLETFFLKQTTAAILLAIAAIVALFLANSPWEVRTQAFADLEAGFVFGKWHFLMPLKEWISSGLMALFFFLIGLEMKREILAGTLRDPQKIMLVVMAALGGMIFPAAIYTAFNYGTAAQHGWAIPMATDTAFAIGVLSLLAKRVSAGISIFLTALAIFDDIGAIAIVALFYVQEIHLVPLLAAGVTLALIFAINISGVRRSWIYALLGIVLWACIQSSGIHPTLAGLLLAIAIPARTRIGQLDFLQEMRHLLVIFEKGNTGMLESSTQHALTSDISRAVKAASTPLQNLETFLIYPVGIVVLPLFALFNAGVSLSVSDVSDAMSSPVTQGIIAGLVVGKPLGITLLTFAGLRLKLGTLPEGMRLTEVLGVGMLSGIGFTMSLFITTLGFEGQPSNVEAAKTGIILASVMAGLAASAWLYTTNRRIFRNNVCI